MMGNVIMAIIGGAIGFLSSIGILIITRLMDRKGKIRIYYKFICQATNEKPWGVYRNVDDIYIVIPAVFELQNTANFPRVIRDLHVTILKGEKEVEKLLNITNAEKTSTSGNKKEVLFGAENNSYSFVLQPCSIQKRQCEFLLNINNAKKEELDFDSIAICYYNEKDQKKRFVVKTDLSGWSEKEMIPDYDWILLRS